MKTQYLAIMVAAALGAGCKTKPENKAADNTAQNARGSAAVPTADQAGQSTTDINIAQSVRKTVTGESILSTNAHNCKIVVNNGVVTLAGPVNTDDERTRIEGIATATPGVTKFVNQLEGTN
jgi:hyperosmotically inducible periplasmic protein